MPSVGNEREVFAEVCPVQATGRQEMDGRRSFV